MKTRRAGLWMGLLATVVFSTTSGVVLSATEENSQPQREDPARKAPEQAELEKRRAELERQRQRLSRELDRLRKNGQEAEATAVKEKLQNVERQMQEMRRDASERAGRSRQPRRAEGDEQLERPEARRVGPDQPLNPPDAMPDLERRRQHLEVAIDNLHAAGLHEVAERLTQQLQRMGQPGPGAGRNNRPMAGNPMGPALQELRAQMRELQQNLQQVRQELEELRRRGR